MAEILAAGLVFLLGIYVGLRWAILMGPNYRWRIKHGCHHGEEANHDHAI